MWVCVLVCGSWCVCGLCGCGCGVWADVDVCLFVCFVFYFLFKEELFFFLVVHTSHLMNRCRDFFKIFELSEI